MRVRRTLSTAAALAVLAPAAGAGTGATRLRITVWPDGPAAGHVDRYTLSCNPARGTVPRPARACRFLSRAGVRAFAPTPPNMVCTDLWGGPARARVRGVVGGRAVDARLSLSNGCEVARWKRVALVVPLSQS